MHAVAPKIRSTHQHDDASRPPAGLGVGGAQPVALHGGEGSVVKIKMQISDRAGLFVANLGRVLISLGHALGERAESEHGGTLEAALVAICRLQLADPDGAT